MARRSHSGSRVWIIGASAGIGAALARELAGRGARLILSARDATALERLASECGQARAMPLDLAQFGALAEAAAAIDPGLDAVICTAALYDPSDVAGIDPVHAEELVRVNLLGTLDVARLTPKLLRGG
jgi:short-subunit dehydrogenase